MITGNPDLDFFDQNPLLKYSSFFKDLKEEYPNLYSNICWALYYYEFPDSPLYNIPKPLRKKEIMQNYIPEIKWELVEKHRKPFLKATMDKEQRLYKITYDKLEELTYDIENKDLSIDSEWKQSMTLIEKVGKLWDSVDAIKERWAESMNKKQLKGDEVESSREKRMSSG